MSDGRIVKVKGQFPTDSTPVDLLASDPSGSTGFFLRHLSYVFLYCSFTVMYFKNIFFFQCSLLILEHDKFNHINMHAGADVMAGLPIQCSFVYQVYQQCDQFTIFYAFFVHASCFSSCICLSLFFHPQLY